MSKIAKIVIHCSDSPDNIDIGVKEIRVWHTKKPPAGRGWSDIGYHYVIRRNGVVESGRYENGDSILEGKEIGAHVEGHNSDSLAICWVGKDKPTKEQKTALIRHTCFLMKLHGLPVEQVYGHKEFNPGKTCPNLDMVQYRKEVAAAFKAYNQIS